MANLRKQKHQKQSRNTPPQLEPKVALYGRVSSDKQSKEQTIERQQSLARNIVHNHFKSKPRAQIGEFWDEGYNLERKQQARNFWQMMAQVEKGEINTIIVASEDRIFRGESAKLRGEITDLLRHNEVRLITSNSDTQYSRSETTDRLVTSIKQELGSINKLEAVRTLQHGRRRKLKEDAKWLLNICPYGLRVDRTVENHEKIYTYRIVENEAKYIRDIFRLYVGIEPESLRLDSPLIKPLGSERIAQTLNKNNIDRNNWIIEASKGVGTTGWDKQKVLRILLNETYTGKLTVVFSATDKVAGFQDIRTEQVITVPAIIDEQLFKKAQNQYNARRLRLVDDMQSRTDINFLHGLLRCPLCDASMRGRVAGGHRYYGCPNTSNEEKHPLLRAEDYEKQIEKYLIELLNELNFHKLKEEIIKQASNQDEITKLNDEHQRLVSDKEQIAAKKIKLLQGWEDSLIDDDIYRERISQLKLRESEITQRLEALIAEQDALSSPSDKLITLDKVKGIFNEIIHAEGEAKTQILKLTAMELIESIKLNKLENVRITKRMSKDMISRYLDEGRVIAKDVRDAFGYQPKQMLQKFGKRPRKSRISYGVDVCLK